MTEAVLVRRIAAALRERGAVGYRTHGAAVTEPGVGDLIVGYQGRYIELGRYYELEVKLPGQHLRPIQRARQEVVEAGGCSFAVVHSVSEALAAIGVDVSSGGRT